MKINDFPGFSISKKIKNIFQIDIKIFFVNEFSKIRMRSEAEMFLRPYVAIQQHFYVKKHSIDAELAF